MNNICTYMCVSLSLSIYIYIYTHLYLSLSLSIYIYIYTHTHTGRVNIIHVMKSSYAEIVLSWSEPERAITLYDMMQQHIAHKTHQARSVFKISGLFLRPRPWQFEIRDSTDK